MPLNDEASRLEVSLTYQLARVNAGSRRILEALCRRSGLSVNQWKLLGIVAKFGPLSAAESVRWLTFDKASVSRAASDLVKMGLVTREADEGDRRSVALAATRRGIKLYHEVSDDLDRMQGAVLRGYTAKEIGLFFRLMHSLDERLQAYDIPDAPRARGGPAAD